MDTNDTSSLQRLLDLARLGDESARSALVGHAYERLRRLAATILHTDFPRLEAVSETGSVVHETVVRLLRAMREVPIPTTRDFFRFSAAMIRRVLLDMARKHRSPSNVVDKARHGEDSAADGGWQCLSDTNHDPAESASLLELQERVDELPQEELEVVDLLWYHGLSQREAAEVLGVSERTVNRRWIAARLTLAGWLGAADRSRSFGRK